MSGSSVYQIPIDIEDVVLKRIELCKKKKRMTKIRNNRGAYMKSMMKKTTLREIKQSLGRYLAIMAIVALGVGFFAGLKVTTDAMIETGDTFLAKHHMFDYRLMSTMGFKEEDVKQIGEKLGVENITGSINMDFIYKNQEGTEGVLNAHTITEKINTLSLVEGRMPEKAGECIIDVNMENVKVGDVIAISDNNDEDRKEFFSCDSYTIVGKANSPLYLNFERGSTSLLSGKIDGFVYLPAEGFDSEYYTEIFLRFDHDLKAYSQEYEDFIDSKTDEVEKLCEDQSKFRYDAIVAEAKEELADANKELSDKEAEAREELAKAEADIKDAEIEIQDGKEELESNEKKLKNSKSQIRDGLNQIAQGKSQMQAMNITMGPQWDALVAQENELNAQLAKVNSGLKKIEEKKTELADGEQELEDGKKEYEESKAEFEKEIADAKEKLQDAEEEVNDLEEPDSYTLTRNENVGYVCFENDVSIVDGVSVVFPVFFFLVAALVCITTMNRMVEEQRTQIGVLKALGYSRSTIMSKYMFYSGSAAVIGCVGGFVAGSLGFPVAIWYAYQMMYTFSSKIVLVWNIPLGIISLVVSLLCSIGSTYFSCHQELSCVTAELIRPKTPKNGKRILLERIGFLWNRLKFLHKVSIRNVFRYKKRFFMMVLGISGCSALLVAGYGIKDSMKNLMPAQYENLQFYDLMTTFKDEPSEEEQQEYAEKLQGIATAYTYVKQESVDLKGNGVTRTVNLIVAKDSAQLEQFISINTLEGEKISYPKDGEVVITHKAADKMGVAVGDRIQVIDTNHKQMELTVSGIAENYVDSFAYMTPASYEKGFEKEIKYTNSFINLVNSEGYEEEAAKISGLSFVTVCSANRTFQNRFNNMLTSMDYIVYVVILCAAALAFIVLYNLTNINITERIREIATIKVLGFYPMETASYVFRENLMLTVVGGLVGLLLGKWLHGFVMYKLDIDTVAFTVYIQPISYVYSFVLTFVFSVFVSILMYFKLNKINMAESLKSIE